MQTTPPASSSRPALTVRRIEPAERTAALHRLGLDAPPIPAAPGGPAAADGPPIADLIILWGGFAPDGRLREAALIVPQPGRTGMVFLSRPLGPGRVTDTAQVLDAACAAAPPDRVDLAQALLAPDDDLRAAALAAAGFWHLATLCYMQARVPRRLAEPPAPPGVRFEPWSEQRRPDFLAVLEASYERTLDCPALHGLRRTEDVLEGHRSTGRFDPELWTLMRVHDEPAGVMLLNPVPAAGCVELVYLGLGARHRGRRLGALLVERGLWQCSQRRQRCLTLAVDESNAPAVRLYRQHRFRRTARKAAFVRSISRQGGSAEHRTICGALHPPAPMRTPDAP